MNDIFNYAIRNVLLPSVVVTIFTNIARNPKFDEKGTGFFITPNLIITCYHTIKNAKSVGFIQGNVYKKEKIINLNIKAISKEYDLALLEFIRIEEEVLPDIPSAYLGDEFPISDSKELLYEDDRFYAFGYLSLDSGNNIISQTGISLTYEATAIPKTIQNIRFKDGSVSSGLSGAPILDTHTGVICGVITNKTRDDNKNIVGGLGVSVEQIFSVLKKDIKTGQEIDIRAAQEKVHCFEGIRWVAFMSEEQRRKVNYQGPKLMDNWWQNLSEAWKNIFKEDKMVSKDKFLNRMTSVEEISCNHSKIETLKPIKKFIYLKILKLVNTNVVDLSPLEYLTNLKYLDCSDSPIENLKGLDKLKNLETLKLVNTNVKDLTIIKQLTSLRRLDCSGSPIENIGDLGRLENLKSVNLSNTRLNEDDLKAFQKKYRKLTVTI